jgi:hypothetical protein
LAQVLPWALLPAPTTFAESPQRFSGSDTGVWTPLPEPTPGESWVPLWLPAPPPEPPEPPEPLACSAPFLQLLPMAGLSSSTTSTVLPQTFTGTSTGTWTAFPDPTPGESEAEPAAPASA